MKATPITVLCARVAPLLLALGLAGCAGRSSAATQSTIKQFDASKSDAKAVQAVDEMIVALGGADAWSKVKQIRWDVKYMFGEELKAQMKHSWDRWNGRHRFESLDMASFKAAQAEGKTGGAKWAVAMYDLFRKSGAGYFDGHEVDAATRAKFIKIAHDRWLQDTYALAGIYKLKDPGVILKYDSEIPPSFDRCKPKCHRIKVTFDEGIGTDTYFVSINTESKRPEILQKKLQAGLLTYALESWQSAGGLQFPGKLQNMGEKREVLFISNIRIGSPDAALYIPRVR